MTAEGRARRTAEADALCRDAWRTTDVPETGVALVAVGGFGRSELSPFSDLDVILVVDEAEHPEPGSWAGDIWYPLWDSGKQIDHSVRPLGAAREAAEADIRVALGLLDARHLAGDPNLTLRLRSDLLTSWRRTARERLPQLRERTRERVDRVGELAHQSIIDLKESEGGLRDATNLKALVATWLVDVDHQELARCRRRLLDVRDALHVVTGRRGDRIVQEVWPDLAERLASHPDPDLAVGDPRAVERRVRAEGQRLAHLSHLTWRRVDAVLRQPPLATRPRRPRLERVGDGVAISGEEIVLDAGARVGEDPGLLLRSAAAAAGRDLVLAPTTSARLVRAGASLPDPWPRESREQLVRLLAAGDPLREVWETLEATGAVVGAILPEWQRVRLLPHATTVHSYTVDRHSVETVIEASRLIRRVKRPDVLLVAALLHDIGKGGRTDHSVEGAPIAEAVVRRMGFEDPVPELVRRLVRHHLLLPATATTRDLQDPSTIEAVASAVADVETLDLLAALTEADARATGPAAWTDWRARLITDLVRRVRAHLGGSRSAAAAAPDVPAETDLDAEQRASLEAGEPVVDITAATGTEPDGGTVVVVAPDRPGLLADLATALAVDRVSVLAARAWTGGDLAHSRWEVEGVRQPAVLRRKLLEAARGEAGGSSAAEEVLRRIGEQREGAPEPVVVLDPDASRGATVLEVRADDRRGTVALVCRALAEIDVIVRSAHVATVGPQAVDVFYCCEVGAGALSETRAADAAHAVRAALIAADTLSSTKRA
ncbi:[protein-PII] uridylyltransferase [Nocardioidaceae bacterium]|nr:[protein-PII] uridylyltransferase [Nocardioidaceae bacterium]